MFSIIIPNWNGAHHLGTCFEALRRQTYPADQLEIILVDNASQDGSQALVTERYPFVKLLALPTNRGFTGACNAGFAIATGKYLSLLNNDTEVDPAWVSEVIAAFDRHPQAGSIASRMMLFDQRDRFHTAGDLYRVNGIPINRGVWQTDHGQYDDEIEVFSACGGSSTYRREALEQTGFLDDELFFSCEDVDLGWRLQLAGWACIYAPRARVYHKLKASGGGSGAVASFHDGRNFIYLIITNYPRPLLVKYGFAIVKAQLGLAWDALRAWRGEAARARLRGMGVGLITIPRLLGKRARVQAIRRVSIDTIESKLTPLAWKG
jgi:GT2 family glycosyltransferase